MFIEHEALWGQWHMVAEAADVDGGPLAVKLLGVDYVVWRGPDRKLVAAPDRCPHRQAPLSAGKVTEGCVVCPYHGWSFGGDGKCVNVPSSGVGRPVPPKAHLATIHVDEQYGLVWLCPGEPVGTIFACHFEDDPSFRRINSGVDVWNTNALRMADNFMDISHFPWVHTGTFGTAQQMQVPHIDLGPLDDGFFGYSYDVAAGNASAEGNIASGTSDVPLVHRHMSTGFHLPLTVRSTIRYESGLEHIILMLSTPIDDVTSYFTFVIWRNDDFSVPAEEVISFDRAIGAEDKMMLEKVPGVLPLEQTATASVQADKPSVEWRRQLAALING